MTPLQLEVALWYYSRGDDYALHNDMHDPQIEAVKMLWDNGMIKRLLASTSYTKTDKLDFYIEHILALPFPVATWEMPK